MLDLGRIAERGTTILLREIVNKRMSSPYLVDVGAFGREGSNIFDLLKHFGWKGLLIEANPHLIGKIENEFRELNVKIVNVSVANYSGIGTLHFGVDDQTSSLYKFDRAFRANDWIM
jgi:hypothetical protein